MESLAGDDVTEAKIELIASYWTLAGNVWPGGPTEVSPHPLKDRAEAAAKEGWKGLGIVHADMCDRAAPYGINVVVEFIPFSSFNTIDLAVELVKDSRPNGGVIVDIWHVDRARRYRQMKTIPPALLKAVELNGAATSVIGTLPQDSPLRTCR
ncbi:hypothetical protein [Paraburkholderia sp. GAS42]|uniref:hypothetical protein n=1 Tax=Paraburkholderia sp. GAS42 TaxID=3035135 RepID=UPI003D21E8F4